MDEVLEGGEQVLQDGVAEGVVHHEHQTLQKLKKDFIFLFLLFFAYENLWPIKLNQHFYPGNCYFVFVY